MTMGIDDRSLLFNIHCGLLRNVQSDYKCSKNQSIEDFSLDGFDIGSMVSCIILGILGAHGVFLNGRAFYYFCLSKTVKNPFNIITINLVMADFLISSIGVALDILGSSLRGKTLAVHFCNFEGLFYMLTGMASLYCTVTLSIIRLFIIKNGDNFWLEGSRLSCKIFVLIMMIWTMAMAIAIPPAIGFGKIGQDMVGISCLPTWSEDSLSDIAYIWLLCIGGGLIPTIIMSISHITSLVNLRKNPELKQNPEHATNKSFWDNRREAQILVMSLTYLVSWTPFGWLYLAKLLGFTSKDTQSGTDMIALLCVKFGCAIINPLVHVFENSKFPRSGETETFLQSNGKTKPSTRPTNALNAESKLANGTEVSWV